MHRPLFDEFFTAGTFLLFLFLSVSAKVPNLAFFSVFRGFFSFSFFPFLTQSPQLQSIGLSPLPMSGVTKSWCNAVGSRCCFPLDLT